MKRKHREAMRAAARLQDRRRDDGPDDDAEETRDWFEQWATSPRQQDETNNNYRSQE